MAVKQAFKLTELGVIPEDWEIAPLSREIDRLEAGTSVNSVDENLGSYSHEQSVLKTSAVYGGQFFSEECKKIAPRDLSRAHLSLRSDSILISRMNTPNLVGQCGYVGADYPNLFLPDRLWMTKKRSGSQCNIRWLSYVLSSDFYVNKLREMATGTSGSMKNIAKRSLMQLPIAFPSPLEQEAIATVLGSVDAQIDALDRLIAKKRDLKKAALQQLVTGKIRLPGFSADWGEKLLGKSLVGLPKYGINAAAVPYSDRLPVYIRITDITNDGRFFSNLRVCVDSDFSQHYQLKEGDIVFARTGASVGKSYLYKTHDGPLVFAGFLIRITPDKNIINPYFLEAFVQTEAYWNWVRLISMRSGQPGINAKEYCQLPIFLPPLPEQVAIASVLGDMERELVALEQRRDKTRALKQGMLQELLTGKTRLVA